MHAKQDRQSSQANLDTTKARKNGKGFASRVQTTRAETKEHDKNAIGVYCVMKHLDVANKKKTLVGHVPIELPHLMTNFLKANTKNKLLAQATGKRKKGFGLFVSAKFKAFTTDLHLASPFLVFLAAQFARGVSVFKLRFLQWRYFMN